MSVAHSSPASALVLGPVEGEGSLEPGSERERLRLPAPGWFDSALSEGSGSVRLLLVGVVRSCCCCCSAVVSLEDAAETVSVWW